MGVVHELTVPGMLNESCPRYSATSIGKQLVAVTPTSRVLDKIQVVNDRRLPLHLEGRP